MLITDYKGHKVHRNMVDWEMYIHKDDTFPEILLKDNPKLVLIVHYAIK